MKSKLAIIAIVALALGTTLFFWFGPRTYTSQADHFTAKFPGRVEVSQHQVSVLDPAVTPTETSYITRQVQSQKLPDGQLNKAFYVVAVVPFTPISTLAPSILLDRVSEAAGKNLFNPGADLQFSHITRTQRDGHAYETVTVSDKALPDTASVMVTLANQRLYQIECIRLSGPFDHNTCQTLMDSFKVN